MGRQKQGQITILNSHKDRSLSPTKKNWLSLHFSLY